VDAFCLMPNHFHLVIQTPRGNLVSGMRWLMSTYTARFNRKHKYFGHLFSGRYKALIIDSSSPGYLQTACNYVHLNPVRAKLLADDAPLHGFRWSSYGYYLQPARKRPGWLRCDRLYGELRLEDRAEDRRQFAEYMQKWRCAENDLEYKPLRRGWFFGQDSFKERLLEELGRQDRKASYRGEPWKESAEQMAQRRVEELLEKHRWTEEDLKIRRKGDPVKVQIASQLRRTTAMTRAWIAQRLCMGTETHLAHLLYWQARKKSAKIL
jgi:putative transposase